MYLNEIGKLSEHEVQLKNSFGGEFINMIEKTSMSKSYKMPLLLAFYNNGDVKMNLTEADIVKSFYDFYHIGSNRVDMLKDNSSKDFESWTEKEYLKLAVDNPIKFMNKTHGEFFCEREGYVMSLADGLQDWVTDINFVEQMKDAIEYRVMEYYRGRFEKKR